MMLTAVYERIALRRIKAGGVVKLNWRYLDRGRPVPCFLPAVFDSLVERCLAVLADPDPNIANACRVSLTTDGLALHCY
jgi:hypothetical protein